MLKTEDLKLSTKGALTMFNNRVLILALFLDYYYTDTDYYQCIRMSISA